MASATQLAMRHVMNPNELLDALNGLESRLADLTGQAQQVVTTARELQREVARLKKKLVSISDTQTLTPVKPPAEQP
jgi:hypothetical protein